MCGQAAAEAAIHVVQEEHQDAEEHHDAQAHEDVHQEVHLGHRHECREGTPEGMESLVPLSHPSSMVLVSSVSCPGPEGRGSECFARLHRSCGLVMARTAHSDIGQIQRDRRSHTSDPEQLLHEGKP